MNEEKIEALLQSYRESIGSASRRLVAKQQRFPRLLLPGGITLALVATAIGLWPRNAVARAFDNVSNAIANARSMEMVGEKVGTKGRRVNYRLYNRGQDWRMEGHLDQGRSIALIFSGNTKVVDYRALDFATIQRCDTRKELDLEVTGEINALGLAKRWVRFGSSEKPPITKLIRNGSTYTIQVEKEGEGLRSEIVVDSSTDLPISARLIGEQRGQPVEIFQRYHFNVILPDSLFKPNPAKRLVRVEEAATRLMTSWATPLASCGETNVHAVSKTPDGTIWVAVATDQDETPALPASIGAGNGASYIRADDFVPLGDEDRIKMPRIAGKDMTVVLVPFVPLDPKANSPDQVELTFAHRRIKLGSDPREPGPETPAGQPIRLLPVKETRAQPAYFESLDMADEFLRIPMALAKTRCLALEKQERWREAAESYLASVPVYEAFVDRSVQFPYRDAARCYRKIGRTAGAERLEALAEASKRF